VQTIKIIHRRALRSKNRSIKNNDWIIGVSTRRLQVYSINVNTGIFTQGDNYLIDKISRDEGASDILFSDGQYHVVILHQILLPEFQTFYDCKNQIINDYRTYLENRLIDALKKKYRVELNHDVLSSIKENMHNC
jgi:hypothetical protein